MIFLYTLLPLFAQDFVLEDLYKPLQPRHVAIAPDGDLYVLDVASARVIHLQSDRGIQRFSGRGNGPGELQNPWSIEVVGNRVWVVDFLRGVFAFDRAGVYQGQVKMPKQSAHPTKVVDGWVYAHDPFDREQPSTLVWTDERGAQETILASYDNIERGMFMEVTDNQAVRFNYNPAIDAPRIVLNPRRDTLYLYQPGSAHITVYDIHQKVIVREIPLGRQPLPFNRDWGEAMAQHAEQLTTLNGKKVMAQANRVFPSHFPLVVDMKLGPDRQLWIQTEQSLMNPAADLQVLELEKGQPDKPADPTLFNRFLGRHEQHLILLAFDKTQGHPVIVKTDQEKLSDALKRWPHAEDDESSQFDFSW